MQVGYEKLAIFDIARFISETTQDRAMVVWNANRNSYAIYRKVQFADIDGRTHYDLLPHGRTCYYVLIIL